MCRWLGYSGDPIAPAELVFHTRHSLIDQSLAAKASTLTTNGDGFGVGWHDHLAQPGLYKHIQPAWNDSNLRDVCEHVRSPLFLAHVRASTGTDIQRSNCHPFRHRHQLFVHNGAIADFARVRRDLAVGIDPSLYAEIRGSTDTELMFFLALSQGLENDIVGAVSRMTAIVERACLDNGVEDGVEMTLGITDGLRLYAFRYATRGPAPSLYYSADRAALREIAPVNSQGRAEAFPDNARVVVSEPLDELKHAWTPVPESAWLMIEAGSVTVGEFSPA